METKTKRSTRWNRWIKRGIKFSIYLLLGYGLILVVGLVPVNNDFVSSTDGVKLYVVSNAVHADILVPRSNEVIDWDQRFAADHFRNARNNATHVAIGWGDRGFFLETETWDDMKLSTAANALLLPSASCMHVTYVRPEWYGEAVAVTITQEQYRDLIKFIDESFKTDGQGDFLLIPGYAYSGRDAFYDAQGHYHLLNTCNSWVGRALSTAGVRVPWLSPLPKTPLMYLPPE